jgi:hypothetical protein
MQTTAASVELAERERIETVEVTDRDAERGHRSSLRRGRGID